MTREEALNILHNASVYHPDYLDALNMAIEALEQEPCDDEYIKVPKKALKYRTAGMVAYNVEWLKHHFDIERAVICGAQEPCTDAISREDVLNLAKFDGRDGLGSIIHAFDVEQLPPVTPAENPNKWIPVSERLPHKNEYGKVLATYIPSGGTLWTKVIIAQYSDLMGIAKPSFHIGVVGKESFQNITEQVTAWMPLPTPYKQEVQE